MQTTKKKVPLDRGDDKDYELQILKVFREKYPKKLVLDNQRHLGRHSKTKRQIDVGIYTSSLKPKLTCVVECKNLSRKVTLEKINSFYAFLDDVGVMNGVIVTTKGFSKGVETYAKSKKIKLMHVTYEYLKDFYYLPPNEVPDVFQVAVRYSTPYCKDCDIRMLYEIVETYGMASHEHLFCPKCREQLTKNEIRSDGNHRIIKIFKGKEIGKQEVEEVLAQHIFATRYEWDAHGYLMDVINPVLSNKTHCSICRHEFCEHPPTHSKIPYKRKNICSSCFMSNRQLLIDYGYIK